MATKGAVGKGAASPAFRSALSDINLECAKFKKEGRIAYIDKRDAKAVYAKYKGACAFCGYPLRSHKRGTDGLVLMFYQPLKYGGQISRDNLIPVCPRCKDHQTPAPRLVERIPNVNTVADIIDRLIVEVHKLAYFENQKRIEHGKEQADAQKIAEWDNKSRDCCELRSILKRELNTAIEEFVCTMQYTSRAEARTFRAPQMIEGRTTIADTIDGMVTINANAVISENVPAIVDIIEEEDIKLVRENFFASHKKHLTDALDSIQKTKQYKIIKE